jgi:tRNA(adenine34) deaminase
MDEKQTHEYFMRLALEQAKLGVAQGGGEIGCVIVKDGKLVASGYNEEELQYDPTAHGEIVTIRKLCKEWQNRHIPGCTIYSTLQPCGMCTVACIWAGITTIVYGAERKDVSSLYFDERHNNTIDLVHDAFRDDITVISGVLEEECSTLYKK